MAQQPKRSSSRLEDILVKAGVVDDMQLRSARAKMANWGGRLPKTLADMGFATEEELTESIGKALRMEVVHLGTVMRDGAAIARLDPKYCEEHGIFPVHLRERVMQLAMADPTDLTLIDEVQSKINARVQPMLASESEILAAVSRHYRNKDYKPIEKERGVRRFTDEAAIPALGTMGRGEREEQSFELDTSAPPRPEGLPADPGEAVIGGFRQDFLARPPSANTLLDEMFDAKRGDVGFTQEELVRLEAARKNQEKTTTILRALQSLLAEKGY